LEPWLIAVIVKPFALLAILGGLLCVRHLVYRLLPDSEIKRFLLRDLQRPGR
jgi:hypothetical protein